MQLEIVSPESTLLTADVDSVIVPGTDGSFQMLDNHAPIVSTLISGKIKILGEIENSDNLSDLFKSINTFDYEFKSGWPKEVDAYNTDSVYHYLLKNKSYLLKTKYLNYGPHKASLKFYLNKQEECFLSRGEQKMLSIIFWLTQVSMLVKNNIHPVVLIDDISSELDNIKIKTILNYLQQLNIQIFMTDIGINSLQIESENTSVFTIENGVITRQ